MTSLPERIGLLSDNHGGLEPLRRAIGVLRRRGAEGFVHLGDFCDSLGSRDPAEMIGALRKNAVAAVKGNNDYAVEKRLGPTPGEAGDRGDIHGYLKGLPVTIVSGNLCFAHSQPYDSVRSLYEPVDDGTTAKAAEIFRRTGHRILFCGHSHLPVLFRLRRGRLSRETLPENRPLRLDPSDRCIIIVGALEAGMCALFDRREQVYESIRAF